MLIANAWGATGLVVLAFVGLFAGIALGVFCEARTYQHGPEWMAATALVCAVWFASVFMLAVSVQ